MTETTQTVFTSSTLKDWVAQCAALCTPAHIHWCDGSDAEAEVLTRQMLTAGTLIRLNSGEYPHCYLHRSDVSDVARVESRTFICTQDKETAGPTNYWMETTEAKEELKMLFAGCMQGRTLYVVPYLMGPVGSPYSKVGVEITDSPYVVLSMRTMTRMGTKALTHLENSKGSFVPGLHSTGDLNPENRYICHFPEENLIWSYGSGYGGNALLGKKCFALRIASHMAQQEGWLAEHMLILEITAPDKQKYYFGGAFPSACGKTNLAMLVVPGALANEGWEARTVGDDIAWIHPGPDGRLWAINPEAGFFGVVPGTNTATNSSAMITMQEETIFTNVALAEDGIPWWEGKGNPSTNYLTDWKGNRRKLGDGGEPMAHPNSRFTAPARNCPTMSPDWESPQGVPLSGILFGGRRADTVPLIRQARSWEEGVFFGATMASQKTAAAEGKVGELRFDPMAMLPFCGYHMGDYFAHWLSVGKNIPHPPAIFAVNWFRKDAESNFLWPGYGDNLRALIWAIKRIRGEVDGIETPIGLLPHATDIPTEGIALSPEKLHSLLAIDTEKWQAEAEAIEKHFAIFGDKLPASLREQLRTLRQ
jgi:phosphoenolpyruvate carboxykinase (GTP)